MSILFSKFPHTLFVEQNVLSSPMRESLTENLTILKKLLPAEDVLFHVFSAGDGTRGAVFYADGTVNKELLGELIIKPISNAKIAENSQNEGGRAGFIEKILRFPEIKHPKTFSETIKEVLDGNALLLIDGVPCAFIIGAKLLPVRAIMEPPTDIAVKGPREGFIEDIKTNMSLVRKRFKTPNLMFKSVKVGKQSNTMVSVCYLQGVSNQKIVQQVEERIQSISVDYIADSSYIATLISPRKQSLMREVATTEKPDIFCAKIAEGRVGILVDGSPIALTVPYLLTEDFQSSEDYFISPFAATTVRILRFLAFLVALVLPAAYVASQLFKMQLLPLGLTLTIASGAQGLPLSPSMETFLILLVLEILKEASIRMPKYVGMSLSVVGALVLGEAAVSAGFVSTTAIIIVAFSGICLYAVPNLVESGSVLRWIFLIVGGSLGIFGIITFAAFLLAYFVSSDAFDTPLLSPFSPLLPKDLRDSVVKYGMRSLDTRPVVLGSKNKTRLLKKKKESEK
ncbi:MAG: spore germination protein [Clostridia bacterium]|nr:spore germination protein [Clostridia bacterium]